MSTGALAGTVMVPFFGALLCITPAITRPTVPFGVRVPAERARATVIRRERHAYYWRTAVIGACCTIAAVLLRGHGSWWLFRIILLLEVVASTRRYRRFLAAFSRAVLTLLALVNLSLLLAALRNWQVYRLSGPGSALPILPFAVGLTAMIAAAGR